MRRVAQFYCVIDTDDEHVANVWLATVNQALDTFAHEAAGICRGRIEIVEPMDAGQLVPVEEADVPPTT